MLVYCVQCCCYVLVALVGFRFSPLTATTRPATAVAGLRGFRKQRSQHLSALCSLTDDVIKTATHEHTIRYNLYKI